MIELMKCAHADLNNDKSVINANAEEEKGKDGIDRSIFDAEDGCHSVTA